MGDREHLETLIRLNMTRGFGARTVKAIIDQLGDPIETLPSPSELRGMPGVREDAADYVAQAPSAAHAKEELDQAEALGLRVIPYDGPDYPRSLDCLYDPPIVLYAKGDWRKSDALGVAVVGARRCTTYGRRAAERLAGELAALGFCIISGMARGIDAAAHRAALNAGGRTVAVLGSGFSDIYPPEHRELVEKIAACGAVFSEFPLATPPERGNFPRRNRIISGLARGVLVVEAGASSGALITARWAMEQDREVFAVPGSIFSPASRGCHRLIRDGAKLTTQAHDIVDELGPMPEELLRPEGAEAPPSLTEPERAVLQLLGPEPCGLDDLMVESGLAPTKVLSSLLLLEAKGLVHQMPGKLFYRVHADREM